MVHHGIMFLSSVLLLYFKVDIVYIVTAHIHVCVVDFSSRYLVVKLYCIF